MSFILFYPLLAKYILSSILISHHIQTMTMLKSLQRTKTSIKHNRYWFPRRAFIVTAPVIFTASPFSSITPWVRGWGSVRGRKSAFNNKISPAIRESLPRLNYKIIHRDFGSHQPAHENCKFLRWSFIVYCWLGHNESLDKLDKGCNFTWTHSDLFFHGSVFFSKTILKEKWMFNK